MNKNTIAIAKPNMNYRYHENFKHIRLEARYVGGKIQFYEVHLSGVKQGKEILLSFSVINSLFNPGSESMMDKPFLRSRNPSFYAVLYRHNIKYSDKFKNLLNDFKAGRLTFTSDNVARKKRTNPKKK